MVREIAKTGSFRTPPPAAATQRPASEQRGRDLLAGAELSRDATNDVFIYDLDSNIPIRDLEQGLLGLFSVFGTVSSVMALPGARGTLQAVVTYTDTSAAEQAMDRLQSFEIWGKPLRLAYAKLQGGGGGPSNRARPSTAPEQTRKQTSAKEFESGRQYAEMAQGSPPSNLESGRRAVQNKSWSDSSEEEDAAAADRDGDDLDVGGMSDLSISPSDVPSSQNHDFASALSDLLSSAFQPRQPSRGEQIVLLDGEEEGGVPANEEEQQVGVDLSSSPGSTAEKAKQLEEMMKAMKYMQELDTLMGELAALQQGQRTIDAFLAGAEVEGEGGMDKYEDSAKEDSDEEMTRRIDEYEDSALDDGNDAQDVLLIGRGMPDGDGDGYLGGLRAQEQKLMLAAERLREMGEKLSIFSDTANQEEEEEEEEEEYEEEELQEDVDYGGEPGDDNDDDEGVEEDAADQDGGYDDEDAEVSDVVGKRDMDEIDLDLEGERIEDEELRREMEEVEMLETRIGYLKGLLQATHDQQQLLQAVETASTPADSEAEEEQWSALEPWKGSDDQAPYDVRGRGIGTEEEDDSEEGEVDMGDTAAAPIMFVDNPIRTNQARTELDEDREDADGAWGGDTPSAGGDDEGEEQGETELRGGWGRRHRSDRDKRLSWADSDGQRRAWAEAEADIPAIRSISGLSRMSESNASNASDAMPETEDLDAAVQQATRDLRDLRLAVHFAQSLDNAAQRRSFYADFCTYFHARADGDGEQEGGEGAGRAPFGNQEGPQAPSRSGWKAPAEAVQVQSDSGAVEEEEEDLDEVDADEDESIETELEGGRTSGAEAEAEAEAEAGEEDVSAEALLREMQRLGAEARQNFIAEVSRLKAKERLEGMQLPPAKSTVRVVEQRPSTGQPRVRSAESSDGGERAAGKGNISTCDLSTVFDRTGTTVVSEYDYAESVSSSNVESGQDGWLDGTESAPSVDGGGSELDVGGAQQAQVYEDVAKEVRRHVAKMARAALSQAAKGNANPSGEISDEHVEELVGVVDNVLADRGFEMDQQLAVSVRSALTSYRGENLVANCEALVQDVSGILFHELVFRQVLERMEKSYRNEMRDIQSDKTFPSDSRAAMIGQLQSHWDQGVSELQQQRKRRLEGGEGAVAQGEGEWQDPDDSDYDADQVDGDADASLRHAMYAAEPGYGDDQSSGTESGGGLLLNKAKQSAFFDSESDNDFELEVGDSDGAEESAPVANNGRRRGAGGSEVSDEITVDDLPTERFAFGDAAAANQRTDAPPSASSQRPSQRGPGLPNWPEAGIDDRAGSQFAFAEMPSLGDLPTETQTRLRELQTLQEQVMEAARQLDGRRG